MANNSFIRLVKNSLRNNGIKDTFNKTVNFSAPRIILGHYLDAMGVLDGVNAYKGPDFVQIDLTNNCNNNCIGCWCNSPLLEEKKISPEMKNKTLPHKRIIKLIDELHKMGTRHIFYAGGGEPFMHPQIMDIVAYTKKKRGLECAINTNFTLVDKNIVKKLVDLKLDFLTVSVWAGSAQVYSATHPNKKEEVFYQIKETLNLLNRVKRKFPIVKIYNVISSINYHELEKMIEFALFTNSEMVEFTVIDTIPEKTDKLLLDDEERQQIIEDCARLKEKYNNSCFKNKIKLFRFEEFIRRVSNIDARNAKYDSDIIGTIPCYAGWAFARILADGNVNSCLKSHRFPVGNILDQDFSKIWNGPRQRFFREKTTRFDKNDPFFSIIGNDPSYNLGCHKSCDNIGHNMHMQGKVASLSSLEKSVLKKIKNIVRFIRHY